MSDSPKNAATAHDAVICRNCALMLARIVYKRHWWFPLVRDPLLLGMRILAWSHRIDARKYAVRNPICKGCLRFMKSELEGKSATFRFLNDRIGDRFSKLRNARLTITELDEAKRFAREAMGVDEIKAGQALSITCRNQPRKSHQREIHS